jgi:glycosyltransferase involved in cell wall biosynthesis
MVTTSFPVGANRASGIFIKRLADNLSDAVELKVLTPCASESYQTPASFKIHCFRYAPSKWQKIAHGPGGVIIALKTSPWLILLLPSFLLAMFYYVIKNGRDSDVIHANWSITGVMAGLAGFFIGKPVITTLRGSDVRSVKRSLLSRFIVRQVFRFNRFVVTVSDAIAQELYELVPEEREKIHSIPNGVGDNLLNVRRSKQKDKLIITTIGNLIPLKDVGTIIRAFERIDGNVQLRIIGDGIERPVLETLSRDLGVRDRVVFLGVVDPAEVERELAMADVFVLGSHSEGRPNVVLEAMAAGCAVVSTDLPGVRELLDSDISGCTFSPGDVAALSEHLRRLISSQSERIRLGKNARKRIIEKGLSWGACGEKYIRLYQRVLGTD